MIVVVQSSVTSNLVTVSGTGDLGALRHKSSTVNRCLQEFSSQYKRWSRRCPNIRFFKVLGHNAFIQTTIWALAHFASGAGDSDF